MGTILNPHLGFRDTARPAMEFYQSVFGGDLAINTFGESFASDDPAEAEKVMHAQLTTPHGLVLMAGDTPQGVDYTPGTNIQISLGGDDEGELRRFWDGLTSGGTVVEPLVPAPWGDIFGMCVDPFGVRWMVNITPVAA